MAESRITWTAWMACLWLAVPSHAGDALKVGDRNLELGGLVTLDHQMDIDGDGNPVMSLKQVALGANVTVSPEILASVLLKAEHDLGAIFFDQAMGSLEPEGTPWTFLFGQQTFNHGLSATRLISDPETLPFVEVKQPGITASYACGAFTPAAGLALYETPIGETLSRDYALLPNLDWTRGGFGMRASGMFSRYASDVDLAASLEIGRFLLDAEAFTRLRAWDNRDRTAGYYAGLQIRVLDPLTVAFRHDGLTNAETSALVTRCFSGGLILSLKNDLFAAAEYSHGSGAEAAPHHVHLQIGLKSTLNLPGFQRETLSQE